MFTPLLAEFSAWHYLYTLWLSFLSIFLILIILVQRGRGGGLTGALGGMGGQSAFGTKAGDLFTKITIGVAIVWVLTTMLIIKYVGSQSQTGGLSTATTSGETEVKKEGKTDKSKVDDKKGSSGATTTTPETKAPAKTPEKNPAETKTSESKTPAKPDGEK